MKEENSALLSCYAANSGIISYTRLGTTYRSHLQGLTPWHATFYNTWRTYKY